MAKTTLTPHTIAVEHMELATERYFAEVRRSLEDALPTFIEVFNRVETPAPHKVAAERTGQAKQLARL